MGLVAYLVGIVECKFCIMGFCSGTNQFRQDLQDQNDLFVQALFFVGFPGTLKTYTEELGDSEYGQEF